MLTRSITRPITLPLTRAMAGASAMASIWTPALLFAEGQQGVWYEPKPEYLYQDSAGTTPVTADGQPVGLMLDRHLGLTQGPELVENGDGLSVTGWISPRSNSSLSTFEGRLRTTSSADGAFGISQEISGLTVGRSYRVAIWIDSSNVTGVRQFRISGTSGHFSPQLSISVGPGVDEINRVFVATATTMHIGMIYTAGAAGEYGEIDDVSFREIPGNHAPQSSASLKPLYAIAPQRLDFDAFDDELPVTFPVDLGTDVTIGRAVPGVGGSILTGQTVGTSYSITEDMAALVIVDEALSADDTSKLQAYLDTMAGV